MPRSTYTKKGTVRKYWCRKCRKVHRINSKIGRAHFERYHIKTYKPKKKSRSRRKKK